MRKQGKILPHFVRTLHNVCAVHRGMSSTPGGYHDKCGGRSLGKQLNLYGSHSVLNIHRCTHDTPSVLNIPRCTAQALCRVVRFLLKTAVKIFCHMDLTICYEEHSNQLSIICVRRVPHLSFYCSTKPKK